MKVNGRARVEALPLRSAGDRGSLLYCAGEESRPTIRRCIIAGRCPAVLSDDGEFALSESVLFGAIAGGQDFPGPVMRGAPAGEPDVEPAYQPMPGVLEGGDIRVVDPDFALRGELLEFFAPAPDSTARAYGAFSGEGGNWPAATGIRTHWATPNLSASGLGLSP